MIVNDPTAKPPSKILAFDSTKEREAAPVDLDSPFFTIARTEYPKCDHRNRGVTLDTATRRAICLCGEVIDCFDALLIYAHAQRRLMNRVEEIRAHERKEAEKKAAKPYVRAVAGCCARRSKRGRIIGYSLTLECGHEHHWHRRTPPRRATCQACIREAKLKATGVPVVSGVANVNH
jgi:hypothetical protein